MNSIINDITQAFKKPNNSLMQLIVINLVIFVLLNALRVFDFFIQSSVLYAFASKWFYLSGHLPSLLFKPWTIITYAFCQVGFMHVLGNVIGLYWFGRIIDDLLGSSRLLGVYIWGSLAGGLVFLLAATFIPAYEYLQGIHLLGASGGVLAVAVAAATLAPDYEFNLVFLGRVKVTWIAAVFVILSFIGLIGQNAGGEIAHLGGAFMGWVFISQLRKGVEFTRPITYVMNFFKALFSPKPKMKVSHRQSRRKTSASPKASGSDISQQEIDAILDKISASGYESLSKDEKQKLFSASQKNKS